MTIRNLVSDSRLMKYRLPVYLALAGFLVAAECGEDVTPNPPVSEAPRRFRMSLTTFAPEPGREARDRTWNFVRDRADLIGLHYDDVELPWEELDASRIPDDFREEFEPDARDARGRAVYVAITPLEENRSEVVADAGGGPFPASLGPALFSNPRLRRAFARYAVFIQETFQPVYMAVGIEVNLYALRNPADFEHLVTLYEETYDALKAVDPALVIFPTLQHEFLVGNGQQPLLEDFEPRLDRIGLATYPSSAGLTPSTLPIDYFSQLRAFSNRGIVITETGYGSRPFDGDAFDAPGSNELQRDYLVWLLDQTESQSMSFIVWFFPTDIPNIVNQLPESSGLAFFGYMGVTAAGFQEKALTRVWRENLARPLVPSP